MSRRIQKARRALVIAGALLVVGTPAASAHPIGAPPEASRSAAPAQPVDFRSPDAKAAEIEARAVPAVAVDLRSADAKAAEIESGAVPGSAVDLRSADARAAEIESVAVPAVAVDRRPADAKAAEVPGRGGRLIVLARPAGPRDANDFDWRAAAIGAALLTIALVAAATTGQRTRRREPAGANAAPVVYR